MTQNYLDQSKYQQLYASSIGNSDKFWAEQANNFITWNKPWHTVSNCDMSAGEIHWFQGAELNASFNCIDRHLSTKADMPAILWEGNEPGESKTLTYSELHIQVCKLSNVLISLGVKAGDRVCIYLPLIPEIAVSMLACARIGAIHTVVFGGFSSEALSDRINDCQSKIVITANEGLRGNKKIPLKDNVDQAIVTSPCVEKVIVINRTATETNFDQKRDLNYSSIMDNASSVHECQAFDSEHPLFILYTSGSTGTPKGVQHSTGGYLTYAAITFHYVFDYKPQEIYWCTADAGWITGHTYLIYGPLANAATIVMYEGVPAYPDASRLWQIVDKYKVNIFYTAPTLLRTLMGFGDQYLKSSSRESLRVLGSVGEPINSAAWQWYFSQVGKSRCPIVDTWWQTETGGILISPLPGATEQLPGCATKPFFGIEPVIFDANDKIVMTPGEGQLAFSRSWPGQMQTLYGDRDRFIKTYLSKFPGYYQAGDGVKRDSDGNYWITGRIDDVLKISGHRVGTAEIESSLDKHPSIAEAAVVGIPDAVTGESVYAFVHLKDGVNATDELRQELIQHVKKSIGSFAAPKDIRFTSELPKTRSGKILRRILRKVAVGDLSNLGDISALGNQEAVSDLLKGKD